MPVERQRQLGSISESNGSWGRSSYFLQVRDKGSDDINTSVQVTR